MNGNPAPDKDTAREFLLKEYDYFTASFFKNEEVGEKRVDFFTAFVTAVIGGLVTLINSENGISGQPLKLTVIAGLFSLLMIGWITLQRLLKRNKATDEFKDKLDNLRKLFRKHYGSESALAEYNPFNKEKKEDTGQGLTQQNNHEGSESKCTASKIGCINFIARKFAREDLLDIYGKKLEKAGKQPDMEIDGIIVSAKTRSMGGLVDFVAIINALLCAGMVAALVYPLPECSEIARSKLGNKDIAIVTVSALTTFFIAFVLLRIHIVYYHLVSAFEIRKPWARTNSD